jgi:uncharacterized protein YecE (DUF72 family)
MNESTSFYSGTSGLVLPFKNRSEYPAHFEGQSRMHIYTRLFNSIEINSIFYKLPRQATIAQWAESATPGFRFTFKLSKLITHSPALDFKHQDLQNFMTVIQPASAHKGCILVQFPPSVKHALLGKVGHLLSCIQQENTDNWPLAVEFRHSSWYTQSTYELLNFHNATLVYHDKRASASPQPELDANLIYLRFHGPDGDYKGSYDRGFLYEYAGYITEWLSDGKTVYTYFNNTMGAALSNLRMLEEFVIGENAVIS